MIFDASKIKSPYIIDHDKLSFGQAERRVEATFFADGKPSLGEGEQSTGTTPRLGSIVQNG